MNATRRSLLAAGMAGAVAWPWKVPAALTPVAGMPGGMLLALVSPPHADAFIGAVRRVAHTPVQRFEASPLDAVALARWLRQQHGAIGVGLLSAAEHIFVNEAFRLAGSRLVDAEGPLVETEVAQSLVLAVLQAASRALEPNNPDLVPVVFIA